MKLRPTFIIAIVVLGAWLYFGAPSFDTLLHWPNAQKECTSFADENRQKLFGDQKGEIKAFSSWMKNGRIVVELGALDSSSSTYFPRLCVIGGNQIQIVSLLENAAWR